MKTILILGGTGMLGNAVGQYFQDRPEQYETWITARDFSVAYGDPDYWIRFDPTGKTEDAHTDIMRVFEEMPHNPDYILNCVGTIKPQMHKNMADSIFINALLPHQLSGTCNRLGIKFITITSDCVYSGFKGKYTETDLHDALDAYGKSKSLGEPEDCMVIRTSIIGEEIHNNTSLIAWAQSQAGKKVSGFRDHLWNGVVTKQYASVCDQIISQELYEKGTFHVHSDSVTKYELLELINARFDLGLQIAEVDSTHPINRTLATTKPLLSKLTMPTIKDQIMNL